MSQATSGRYLNFGSGTEAYRAFIPAPLPPNYELSPSDYDLMERANRALGRLDGISALLPDKDLFLYLYVRKEAVLSSQIEGTQSSLSELLSYESLALSDGDHSDVAEVSRYVKALDHGLNRLREGFPLSLRLIREIHEVLMVSGRGSHATPGEFRRTPVWIGGTSPSNAAFVPTPVSELMDCLCDLESYLHSPETPVLIKAALAHVQFETIHPFLDGNGRVGRLLITFLLCAEDVLSEPLLYLSLYFKTHRSEYYRHLQRIRTHGEWAEWLRFFMQGVRETSTQAVSTAKGVLALFEVDREHMRKELGRSAGSALQVHEALQRRPIATLADIARASSVSYPTAKTALDSMTRLGILDDVPARRKTYRYGRYLDLLERGIEAET